MPEKGTVKFFSSKLGYGFITVEGKDKDIFVHYSSIKTDGFKTLKAGDKVSFEIVSSPKGLQASNVVVDKE